MLDFDHDYSERAKKFMAEAQRRHQEKMRKEKRRILWIGKFAFPKVNTKKTRLLFLPPDYHRYYIPVVEPLSFDVSFSAADEIPKRPRREAVDLNKWGYKGRRWRAIIRFGYYEPDDVLIVNKESFVYQQKHVFSNGDYWWVDNYPFVDDT